MKCPSKFPKVCEKHLRGESFLDHVFSLKSVQTLELFGVPLKISLFQHYGVAFTANKLLKCIWELRNTDIER